MIVSPLAPFEFLAEHIEEHHVGRTDQADAMLRAPADNSIAGFEDLADLAVDGHICRRVVEHDHMDLALIRHDDGTISERVRADGSDGGGGYRGEHDWTARRKR